MNKFKFNKFYNLLSVYNNEKAVVEYAMSCADPKLELDGDFLLVVSYFKPDNFVYVHWRTAIDFMIYETDQGHRGKSIALCHLAAKQFDMLNHQKSPWCGLTLYP